MIVMKSRTLLVLACVLPLASIQTLQAVSSGSAIESATPVPLELMFEKGFGNELAVGKATTYRSVFLGGDGGDHVYDVAIHPISGNAYVVGESNSEFIVGAESLGVSHRGAGSDAFIALVDVESMRIKRVAYLGGSADDDEARSIAFNQESGDVYVVGVTRSSDFPATSNGFQLEGNESQDFFVAHLNAELTELYAASYLGGGRREYDPQIVVFPASGDVYVVGSTQSHDFPGTGGGAQEVVVEAVNVPQSNGIVVRLDSNLTTIRQATYLSGIRLDEANAIVVDWETGDVYVAGMTESPDFLDSAAGLVGESECEVAVGGYIVRMNGELTAVEDRECFPVAFSSLVIGSAWGQMYAAGQALSDDLPMATNGAQPSLSGDIDVLVMKVDKQNLSVSGATYFGGELYDEAARLAIHPDSGNVYLVGVTNSRLLPGSSFGIQAEPGEQEFSGNLSSYDFYVAKFNPTLTTLRQVTYFGGALREAEPSVAIGSNDGKLYLSGFTTSKNFPGTQPESFPGSDFVSNGVLAQLSADLGGDIKAAIDSTYAGTWFDIAHAGEGFLFEVLESEGRQTLVVYFFTYAGVSDAWFVGVGPIIGRTAVLDLVVVDAPFGTFNGFDPARIERVERGSMSVRFDECGKAQVNFLLPLRGLVSYPVRRLTPVMPGLAGACGAAGGWPLESSLFGSWFNLSRSGEGFIFDLVDIDGQTHLVTYWFSLASRFHRVAWLHGLGAVEDGVAEIELKRYSKSGSAGVFDPAEVVKTPWGHLRVEFLDCNSGRISYSGSNDFEPISYTIKRLTPPPDGGDEVCSIP